jgi:hypothetical protein
VDRTGGLLPNSHFVVVYAYDYGWTTNLPAEHLLAADALAVCLEERQVVGRN